MLFNSVEFLLFLPIVVVLYYLLPGRLRWVLLLAGSYFFYMSWKPGFAILIAASTLLDYAAALGMDRIASKRKRTPLLVLSLLGNLGMLFSFKYADFFIHSTNQLAGTHYGMLNWVLPVGISFYTFQTLSYTLDVYHGRAKAERHLGYFALFVIYFPQLVAGPIERYPDLAPQLRETHPFTYANISRGFRLVLLGLFIKMVIADNLAPYVDAVYRDPSAWNGSSLATALLFYSFQIYGDFYGYSLVAMGSARMLGVGLMHNFKTPYLAISVADFWQRWHVSLSQWFRDYVFIPVGGSRVNFLRLCLNILLVFGLSGLWHGANWTFVFWGLGWGGIYIVEKAIGKRWKLKQPLPWRPWHLLNAGKMLLLASLAWIAFRSTNMANLKLMLQGLWHWPQGCASLDVAWIAWVGLGLLILTDLLLYNRSFDLALERLPLPLRWCIYALLVYGIVVFPSKEEIAFIYFQF